MVGRLFHGERNTAGSQGKERNKLIEVIYMKMYPVSCAVVLSLAVLVLCACPAVSARELAVTMDDLPFIWQGKYDEQHDMGIATSILDTLDSHTLKMMGFVTGWRVKKPYQRDLLARFVERGHTLGNHTFKHLDLNTVSAGAYGDNISLCEEVIKEWVTGPRFFRYPYLHRGNTEKKRDDVYTFLSTQEYTTVPVTIVAEDWIYDEMLEAALKKNNAPDLERIGRAYVAHAAEKTKYYEGLAGKKVKRPIRHILLLHMKHLNARCLGDLLAWYHRNGWTFITVQDALKDPVYSMKDRVVSPETLSWLERI